jgi:two-component system OmpR family sensor kinase
MPATEELVVGPPSMGRGTLARRLVLQVAALVALVAVGLGLLSTLAVRQLMLKQLDQQVAGAANRIPGLGPASHWDGSWSGSWNGPRQQVGTLIVLLPDSGQPSGFVLGELETSTRLKADELAQLKAAVSHDHSVVFSVDGFGRYRVVRRDYSGMQIVTGLPMDQVDRVLTGLGGLELILASMAVGAAALAARALVRRSLRPLNRLATTATHVSQLELDRGEVALAVRVPAEDADPRSEVGRVGQAFNHMLTNVDGALAVRQASEIKLRQFIADASHELRNPLAAIRGYAELTRRSRDEMPSEAAYAMSRVESEADRMSKLVEDLLLLARLDSGPALDVRPTDLTEMVINAVSDARAAGPDHSWALDLPDVPITALGDAHRLHQVVANLLANARTHTPPGTRVETGLSIADHQAVLTVTDNGPGVPPEIQHAVFERFTRADTSRVRASGGENGGSTGLGLAIVAAVVEAHQGSVTVESVPGRTRFAISLPLASQPDFAPAAG